MLTRALQIRRLPTLVESWEPNRGVMLAVMKFVIHQFAYRAVALDAEHVCVDLATALAAC